VLLDCSQYLGMSNVSPRLEISIAVSRANQTLADSSPRSQVRVDYLGISDGRIRANNTAVVFHP
jgi:hypothetical protein